MQTPRKRKRETLEFEHPRITYDAPTRTFDRLFKEDSLDGMKDVVRKKLGVATSVPIYLSQVRDGTSVDLEDDDDFDAFRAFAHASQAVHVNVAVGSDAPFPNGGSERSNATVPPPVPSSSVMVNSPPPQKKRRVSFVELPGDQSEGNTVDIPATPGKKKHKHAVDSSAPLESGNEMPSDITTGKKKKKKKKLAKVSDDLTPTHPENVASGAETPPQNPSTEKTKKRQRESISEVTSEVVSSTRPQQRDSLSDQEDDGSRPTKKSKKKREEPVDEPTPLQNSSSKPVLPPSIGQTSKPDVPRNPTSPSIEPETSVKPKKTNLGRGRAVSDLPSAPVPSSPEQVRDDEVLDEKKKKGKGDFISSSVGPSTTTGLKATEVKKKLAKQKETPPSESATPDQAAEKKKKAAAGPQKIAKGTTSRNDGEVDTPRSPAPDEPRTPRNRRKSAESSKELRTATIEAAVQAVLARKVVPSPEPPAAMQAESPAPSVEEEEPTELCSACPFCDESPSHDRSLCPVVKNMRAMRKRVGQLQKDTSGDETKQEQRQKVIAELQAMIQKRERGPRTAKATANGSTKAGKAAVKQNEEILLDAPAPIVATTKSAKQVDVVSPPTRIVDVVPPAASSQPIKSTSSTAKSSKTTQPSSSQLPPSQKPSLSQKSVKTVQDKSTAENLMTNLPLVSEPKPSRLGDLSPEELSQFTDSELQSIIHGPKVSIADMPSSDEDEEGQDQEEPFLDEDEALPKASRRLSQGAARSDYPSSSDAEEDEYSVDGGDTRAKSPSVSTEGEDQPDDREITEDPLPVGEGDTSFREVDTRGSSRDLDRTGDDAVERALEKDFAIINAVQPINGKPKTTEADSDTAVGSQGEDLVNVRAKEKKVEDTTAVTAPEHAEQSSDEQPELIVSDDDQRPVHSTPKVESTIRTRSQRKKDAVHEKDYAVQPSRDVKKTRKITDLPVPSPAHLRKSSISTRRSKAAVEQEHEAKGTDVSDVVDNRPPKPSINGKVGSKTPGKDTRRSAGAKPKDEINQPSKSKAPAKAANGMTPKPKSLYKVTSVEPIRLADAINTASKDNHKSGSQRAFLQESHLTETPEQVDELFSDSASQPVKQNQVSGDPLFLPSESQQSFPYSQFPDIFASQKRDEARRPSSHESEDEDEVLASVVKAKPLRTYRSLSQIAGSQTFTVPKFQPANFGGTTEPARLYGSSRHDVDSETDSSSSESDKSPVSHIPASRRAGLLKK